MSFPRTLLLTNWRPDGRYAGAEAIRRILLHLPRDRVRWAALQPCLGQRPEAELPPYRCFVPRSLHWRFRDGFLDHWYRNEFQARRVADSIAAWVSPWKPERIWVLPELSAIRVGTFLGRRLGVPVHATVFDTLESARRICIPGPYYPFYMRQVRGFFGVVDSYDAVSRELVDHVRSHYGTARGTVGIVFHPSVPLEWMQKPRRSAFRRGDATRRVAFCGAFRQSAPQWQTFLDVLGRLLVPVEVLLLAARDTVHEAGLPANVRLRVEPYMQSERELIRTLQAAEAHAGYLGLWRGPEHRRFVRTSLSSKLATYAAASLPVLCDAPADTPAWRLLERRGAGMLLTGDSTGDTEIVERLFGDEALWAGLAAGSHELCARDFSLQTNIQPFVQLLSGG